jgi:hypothetical protein
LGKGTLWPVAQRAEIIFFLPSRDEIDPGKMIVSTAWQRNNQDGRSLLHAQCLRLEG